ncbi:uncharacterized protein LOC124356976 isoform X3 [Homalodisca vitripennis]|uniref:uncharacterized protein LOC124356976 isoform X3 n=1 Tax=Homalodisca vitripennis TaxID=197043 RepID=UPI001EEC2796|nr:uncharacterized protein LOC124356976 isoform X3 [Homalodisca vitripennis]
MTSEQENRAVGPRLARRRRTFIGSTTRARDVLPGSTAPQSQLLGRRLLRHEPQACLKDGERDGAGDPVSYTERQQT